MAFRASNAIPALNYEKAKRLAYQIKRMADSRAASFASGGTADEVLAAAGQLNSLKTQLQEVASTPGLAAYASDQENDQNYNVTTEYVALIAAIDAVTAFIVSAIPADGDGWLLIHKINADGSLTPRNFSGAALSGLVTVFTDLSNAIS